MIHAKDLMLGDWVKMYNGKGEYIDDTRVDINTLYTFCQDGQNVLRLDPIPLTPEILEKNADCGWCNYQSEPKGRSIYHIGNVALYVEWERIAPSPYIEMHGMCDTFFKGYIDYVHQLQHVLRFCGIEKEIMV